MAGGQDGVEAARRRRHAEDLARHHGQAGEAVRVPAPVGERPDGQARRLGLRRGRRLPHVARRFAEVHVQLFGHGRQRCRRAGTAAAAADAAAGRAERTEQRAFHAELVLRRGRRGRRGRRRASAVSIGRLRFALPVVGRLVTRICWDAKREVAQLAFDVDHVQISPFTSKS